MRGYGGTNFIARLIILNVAFPCVRTEHTFSRSVTHSMGDVMLLNEHVSHSCLRHRQEAINGELERGLDFA